MAMYNHDRQDLVNHFFGYIGMYRYLKKTGQIPSISKKLEDLVKQIKGSSAGTYSKSYNVMYLYGGPRCGKKEYINLLGKEIEDNGDGFVRLELNGTGNLLEMIKEAFERKTSTLSAAKPEERKGGLGFRFACVNMIQEQKTEKKKSNLGQAIISGLSCVYSGDPFSIAQNIIEKACDYYQKRSRMEAVDQEIEETFQYITDKLDKYKKENRNVDIDIENPYLWMELDLMANLKMCRKPTVVCVIENFHLWERYCFDAVQKKKFLQFLNMMSDVIWVLVSEEKPGDLILGDIYEGNIWRMPGLNKDKTIKRLENTTLMNQEKWRDEVWRRTGGYIGLIDLCLEKEKQNSGIQQWCIEKEKAAQKDKSSEDIDKDKMKEEWLKSWFGYVWRGMTKEEMEEAKRRGNKIREESIEFLMRKEIANAADSKCEDVKKYILPCICYLIKKTLENPHAIGTVKQFSWDKNAYNANLTDTGKKCMEMIQDYCPFCIEYAEFPDTVYLDPIIIEVISNHNMYEEWLKMFEEKCVVVAREGKIGGEKNIHHNLAEKDEKILTKNSNDLFIINQQMQMQQILQMQQMQQIQQMLQMQVPQLQMPQMQMQQLQMQQVYQVQYPQYMQYGKDVQPKKLEGVSTDKSGLDYYVKEDHDISMIVAETEALELNPVKEEREDESKSKDETPTTNEQVNELTTSVVCSSESVEDKSDKDEHK